MAGQRNCSLYIGWANLYELPREVAWPRLYANTPGPNEMAWLDKETAAYMLVGPTSRNCQERWLGQGYELPREATWPRPYANTPGANEMARLNIGTETSMLVGPTSMSFQAR